MQKLYVPKKLSEQILKLNTITNLREEYRLLNLLIHSNSRPVLSFEVD